ncbi:beta-amylase 7-like isoform X2 [Carex littledalei]|uniref:Beta-amylase n=1 Tax=Carex littledalei TaxID=544730 RepID=A0A833VUG6_9POAL|nr:beta-amylase 7-like isoform X2 [Carex littledalei]
MVDCWWGIVEANQLLEYNRSGYKHLFHIIRQLKLKLQVVMTFHKCGGNVGHDMTIPLPNWIAEIGSASPDIYFTDIEELDEFFEEGVISEIEVGLGPCGELRYPSYRMEHGWRYPGIGEFQCYDRYLRKSFKIAAQERGHSFWGKGPDNAGTYNSRPQGTGFFCDGGDYDAMAGFFSAGTPRC